MPTTHQQKRSTKAAVEGLQIDSAPGELRAPPATNFPMNDKAQEAADAVMTELDDKAKELAGSEYFVQIV